MGFFRCIVILIVLLGFTSSSFGSSIQVSWDANSGDGTTGYKVYYGNETGSYLTSIDVGNVTTYIISDVTYANTYYIAVSAYDAYGNESALSDELHIYIPVPDTTPPPVVALKPSGKIVNKNTVTLTWGIVTAEDLAGYGIYDNGTWIGGIGPLESPSFNTSVLSDGTHIFTIDSYDTSGNRSAKSEGLIVIVDTTPPSSPKNPKITIIK